MNLNPNSIPLGAAGYGQHSLLSSLDALPPDVSQKLYKSFGYQGLEILNLLLAQGNKRVVNNSNGSFHFEEDRYNQAVPVATITSGPGDSATLVFTISSTEVDTENPFVVVGDLLIDMATETRLKVTAVTGGSSSASITAVTLDGADVPSTITTSTVFAIYSSQWGEDTAQPDAKATYWTKYAAPMQRHKTTAKITGDALTDKLFPVYMEDGKTIAGFHTALFAQHEYRHLLGLVGSMILGKAYPTVLPTAPAMMGATTGSYAQGMVDTFQNRAVQGTWTDSASIVGDLYDLTTRMKANWVGTHLTGLLSQGLYTAFEQGLLNETQNVNIATTRTEAAKILFGNNTDFESMYTTFGFNTVILNGKVISAKANELSNDPTLFNASGSTAPFYNYGFFMSAEKERDAAGLLRGNMELIYKSENGENRFMKMWDDGAASPRKIGPNDNWQVYMLTQFGFDWFKIEQCGLLSIA